MPGGVGGEDHEASSYPDKDWRKAFSIAFERPEGLRSTNSLVSQFRRGALVGITISHYKAIVKIGQGGMGEVYRAEDTNLSHEMAIKVPPEQFTQDLQPVSLEEALVVSQDRSQEKCNGA